MSNFNEIPYLKEISDFNEISDLKEIKLYNTPELCMKKIDFLNNIPQFKQKSIEWLNQRKGRLTASDCATALSINPYENPDKLLFRKCGLEDAKKYGSTATKHGEAYENQAIGWYCKLMNKTNFEYGLIDYTAVNPIRRKSILDTLPDIGIHLDFLAGSPDGIAIDNDNMEEPVLLEIKCPFSRPIYNGKIPVYYYPQVQINMAIFDVYKADYIEYNPNTKALNIVRIHRNDKWLYNNIQKLYTFWQEVLYWRKEGIKNHPKLIQKEQKNNDKLNYALRLENEQVDDEPNDSEQIEEDENNSFANITLRL